MERIEQHRPLAQFPDRQQRTKVQRAARGLEMSFAIPDWIDGSLYPDIESPDELPTLADRVNFLARLCAAWDFGVVPYMETIREIRRPEWREAVEACRLLTSHTYHLLRRWHKLSQAPYLGQRQAYIRDDPNLAYI